MSLSYSKKTYTDNSSSGSGLSASDLNKIENGIYANACAINEINDTLKVHKNNFDNIEFQINANGNFEIWFNKGDSLPLCLNFSQNHIGVYNGKTRTSKNVALS